MKPRVIALVSALLLGSAFGNSGMEFGFAMPYAQTAIEGRPIFSLSWFTGQLAPFPGYDEYGFVAMPPIGDKEPTLSDVPRITDFVGMYAGHLFIPFHGWIRPGFDLGWIWEGRSYLPEQGTLSSQRTLSLYYALKIQFSCLSFITSNKGIGGGFNFRI
jgi:hypothetical protein